MKTRNGFVSNSSSTSFLIASKAELTKEKVESLFGIPEDSPFKELIDKIVNAFYHSLDKPFKAIIEYIRETGDDDPDEKIQQWFKDGFFVYQGLWSTEDEPMEAMLCETSINYESDDLIIKHDRGP